MMMEWIRHPGSRRWLQHLAELPVLLYLGLHFFPPGSPALLSISFVLSLCWGVFHWRDVGNALPAGDARWLLGIWIAMAALLGASIVNVPPGLSEPSWRAYWSWIGKGSLFAAVILVFLNDAGRARRLLLAGMLAALAMLVHQSATLVSIIVNTGTYPIQRDYLYWLLPFFPFALACLGKQWRWRWPAGVVVVGTIGLAVNTGYRGAMLALLGMLLLFSAFGNFRKQVLVGLAFAAAGAVFIVLAFPEQGQYVLHKLTQTDSSLRVRGLWLPTWDMFKEAPWLGHGFGYDVFAFYYEKGVPTHPEWTALPPIVVKGVEYLSPHSITFELLFAIGLPGVLLLAGIFAILLRRLWLALRMRAAIKDDVCLLLHVAAVVALLGNYGMLAQTEAPSWRTLPILLGLVVATSRFQLGRTGDEARESTARPESK